MNKFYQLHNSNYKQVNCIDFIPKNGIKCIECNIVFTKQNIDQHLITHIHPKYLTPNIQNTGAKKLKSYVELTDDTVSIGENRVLNNIPKLENIRKEVKVPYQVFISNNSKIAHPYSVINKQFIQQKPTPLNFDQFLSKQFIQRQNITKNIELGQQESFLLNPQLSISKYNNSILQSNYNKYIKTNKKVNPFQFSEETDENSKEYQLSVIENNILEKVNRRNNNINNDNSVTSQSNADSGYLVLDFKKHKQQTPYYEQISTKKNKSNKLQSKISKLSLQHNNNNNNNSNYHTPNGKINSNLTNTKLLDTSSTNYMTSGTKRYNPYECTDCGGFYCSTCNSSIPPQYRPVNMEDIDIKIKMYYKEHVYNQKCQCNNSNCNNNKKYFN